MLAQQKMEQLRGLTWGFDILGCRSATTPPTRSVVAGSGCTASRGGRHGPVAVAWGTLSRTPPAGSTYLDGNGCISRRRHDGAGQAIYIRRWSVEPLPTNPNNTLILQVLVTRRTDRGEADAATCAHARRGAADERQDEEDQMRRAPSKRAASRCSRCWCRRPSCWVTASVFSLLNPAHGTFQAQPEVSDMQQRLRVAADTVQKDLVMAGAGIYSGIMVGTLDNYFAPILPHRVGTIAADPAGTFRANPLCPLTLRVGHHDHVRPDDQRADDDPHRHAEAVGRAQGE